MKKKPVGIRRDRYGFRAYVRVGGVQRERRYKPDTPLTEMQAWRDKMRVELRDETPLAGAKAGTFAANIVRYLKAVAAMPTIADRTRDLEAWLPRFDQRARSDIKAWEIRAQRDAWLVAGAAPSTVRHRLTALMQMWTVLDGKSARNPVRDVPPPPDRAPAPRGFDVELARQIVDAMPNRGQAKRGETPSTVSLSKLRLRVILETGLPHKAVGQILPGDFDPQARTLVVGGRKKGKGTKGRTVPLTQDGAAAVKALLAAGAIGPFSRSSLYKSFQRGCKALRRELERDAATRGDTGPLPTLTGLRPYDFRHVFGTRIYRQVRDVKVVKELLGHARLSTSERYMQAAVAPALEAAIALMDASKAGSPSGSQTEPTKGQ